jgi:hypothetical protein
VSACTACIRTAARLLRWLRFDSSGLMHAMHAVSRNSSATTAKGRPILLPGTPGYRAFVNAAYEAGVITFAERRQLRIFHCLMFRLCGERAELIATPAESEELLREMKRVFGAGDIDADNVGDDEI